MESIFEVVASKEKSEDGVGHVFEIEEFNKRHTFERASFGTSIVKAVNFV